MHKNNAKAAYNCFHEYPLRCFDKTFSETKYFIKYKMYNRLRGSRSILVKVKKESWWYLLFEVSLLINLIESTYLACFLKNFIEKQNVVWAAINRNNYILKFKSC